MEAEDTGNKKITLQDIINEGKNPIQLRVSDGKYLEYIMPTGNDVDALQSLVDKDVIILREQHRMEYPNVLIDENSIAAKKAGMLNDLILWKGLNKADNTVTQTMINELPNEVKAQLSLQISMQQFRGMSEENIEEIKNVLQMTKGVASPS